MDASILPNRPDVVIATSAPRPTATPPRVSFSEVLAQGATTLVRGADQAVSALPGAPLMAVALRGGVSVSSSLVSSLASSAGSGSSMSSGSSSLLPNGASYVAASPSVSPEGPSAAGTTGTGTGATSATDPTGMQGTLQQSQEMNIYYLQLQEQVNQQNRTYSALSDVLKAEHDTVKTAIGNIH